MALRGRSLNCVCRTGASRRIISSVTFVVFFCWISVTSAFSANYRYEFSPQVYASLGSAIQSVDSWTQGLELASQFWLPSDGDALPPHFTQPVHHEKRQRWASQLLTQLATSTATAPASARKHMETRQVSSFGRLIQAAAEPHPSLPPDRLSKEAIWISDSLQSIHAILGRLELPCIQQLSESSTVVNGMECLIARAQSLGGDYPLDQACQVFWAMQGIQARMPSIDQSSSSAAESAILLKERVESLPFQIMPGVIDWSQFVGRPSSSNEVCDELLQVIPFRRDIITTRQGASVAERRGTAWIAAPGIGALAYSGKLMAPQPLPALVSNVMRAVERRLDLTTTMSIDETFFDCALCNHYTDASSACKFHTDPEHGTMWDRTTVVLAAGSDRTFAFKPIQTIWDDWDIRSLESGLSPSGRGGPSGEKSAATTTLFAGDLVVMRDTCNDDFFHAVHAGLSDDPRVSLVFKRAIGARGHGLAGQGRRHRRRLDASTGAKMADSRNQADKRKPLASSAKKPRRS